MQAPAVPPMTIMAAVGFMISTGLAAFNHHAAEDADECENDATYTGDVHKAPESGLEEKDEVLLTGWRCEAEDLIQGCG